MAYTTMASMRRRNCLALAAFVALAACQWGAVDFAVTPLRQSWLPRADAATQEGGSRFEVAGEAAGAAPLAVGVAASVLALLAARSGRPVRQAVTALRATRAEWFRRVKRLPGDLAVFDVVIPKPLGLRLQEYPQRDGVGVAELFEGGNAYELSRKVIFEENDGMWILEGDQVLAIDGQDVEDFTVDEMADVIKANAGDSVTLTLQRNTRLGPIRVVVMPEGVQATVRRGIRLSAATEYAGRESDFGCIDGWCGTCWHRERSTNGVFKPCCDVLTGDWDNTMPMVLTPKPERAGDATLLKPRGA
mmetsp:Transcript_66793/g.124802  ORF Transcript_66793/g.124802 Transcript_66793/m.124802 type:complete len:304 (-) Transcript_66793:142-1053(-)